MPKNQSYVYQAYVAILDRHEKREVVTMGDLLDRRNAPLAHYARDPQERGRVSGALAALVEQGVLKRLDYRVSRHRAYRVIWLSDAWRPRLGGNRLGVHHDVRNPRRSARASEVRASAAGQAKSGDRRPQRAARGRDQRMTDALQRASASLERAQDALVELKNLLEEDG